MSFGSSGNDRMDTSGEVGSSMEVGWTIGYVSSKSIGTGEGVRALGNSRREGFEELSDGCNDACAFVCGIGWCIVR